MPLTCPMCLTDRNGFFEQFSSALMSRELSPPVRVVIQCQEVGGQSHRSWPRLRGLGHQEAEVGGMGGNVDNTRIFAISCNSAQERRMKHVCGVMHPTTMMPAGRKRRPTMLTSNEPYTHFGELDVPVSREIYLTRYGVEAMSK